MSSSARDRGNQFYSEKKYKEAVAAFSDAIASSPGVATFYTNRALCYLKLEQWIQVVEDCQKALCLESTLIKAHFFMGQALIEIGSYDEAIISLKTAHKLAKDQHKNFGEDIPSAVRYAKKKRWNALEEKRLKQESELQTFLVQLLTEHRSRQLSQLDATDSTEDRSSSIERIHKEFGERSTQLNKLFEDVDEKRRCREVPDYLCGKISFELMTDPCITPSGITYDRKDIEEHLQRVGHFDPVTRKELTQDQLIPNLAMKEVVDGFISDNGWVEDY